MTMRDPLPCKSSRPGTPVENRCFTPYFTFVTFSFFVQTIGKIFRKFLTLRDAASNSIGVVTD